MHCLQWPAISHERIQPLQSMISSVMYTNQKLPSSLPGVKNCWPWTKAGDPLPNRMLDGTEWPHISIVTPSYNQCEFLEETIRSVLLQGYPNLEYIIIDGGSADNSIEIIKKYEKYLTYWVSEKDRGQSHAINKGFEHATGEIYCWLNSDDFLLPGALKEFAQAFFTDNKSVAWAGIGVKVDKVGSDIGVIQPSIDGDVEFIADWWISSKVCQPACSFSAELFKKVGGLDEDLHYAMDFDLWLKLRRHGKFSSINNAIACARLYPEIKTYKNTELSDAEIVYICVKYGMYQAAENRMKLVRERNVSAYISTRQVSSFGLIREIFNRLMLALRLKNR